MKRIRATEKPEEPKEYPTMIGLGYQRRQEGEKIDYIECVLLRSSNMQESWRMGWRKADAELRKGNQRVRA